MITSLHASPSSALAAPPSLARSRRRCPFLHEVASAQPAPQLTPHAWPSESDARAGEVLSAFERTGGVAGGDELTFMLRARTSQPLSMLARWIVERRVVSFGWRGRIVLPMFQFDRADMSVSRDVSAVLDEFDGTFDDCELATWFALPNSWLGERAPVDVLAIDAPAVLDAARADRFIARG